MSCYKVSVEARVLLSHVEERLDGCSATALAGVLSSLVTQGVVKPGTQLPPIRTVARELGLSPTTVSRAWKLLAHAHVVRASGRRGTVVTDPTAPVPSRYRTGMAWQGELRIDLSTGTPDPELLPPLPDVSVASLASQRGYLGPSTLPELRDVLLSDWPFLVRDVVVVDGAMDGLDLALRTLAGRGSVALETPSFGPIRDLTEAASAAVVPLRLDDEGVVPASLRAALREGIGVVILQPRAQNPTGVSMTATRAARLAELLIGTDVVVVEDDAAGLISTAPPVSLGRWLGGERVLHLRSFSKSHGPDLRLAAMSGPADVLSHLTSRRFLGQGWSSWFLQRLLATMLTDSGSVAAVAVARETYARRRRAVVAALRSHGLNVSDGDGLNVWVPVEDETAAVNRLAAAGVGVAPGSAFMSAGEHPPHVRVNAGVMPPDGLSAIVWEIAAASKAVSVGSGGTARCSAVNPEISSR